MSPDTEATLLIIAAQSCAIILVGAAIWWPELVIIPAVMGVAVGLGIGRVR